MKLKLALSLSLIVIFSSTNLNAEETFSIQHSRSVNYYFGPCIWGNLSKIPSGDYRFDSKPKLNFGGGATVIRRSDGLSYRFDLNYLKRRTSSKVPFPIVVFSNPVADQDISATYLGASASGLLFFSNRSTSPFIELGPGVEYKLDEELTSKIGDMTFHGTPEYRDLNLTVRLGGGWLYYIAEQTSILFELQYIHGLIPSFKWEHNYSHTSQDVLLSVGVMY